MVKVPDGFKVGIDCEILMYLYAQPFDKPIHISLAKNEMGLSYAWVLASFHKLRGLDLIEHRKVGRRIYASLTTKGKLVAINLLNAKAFFEVAKVGEGVVENG